VNRKTWALRVFDPLTLGEIDPAHAQQSVYSRQYNSTCPAIVENRQVGVRAREGRREKC